MSNVGKILIVEDSLITSLHLEKLATSSGYSVCGKTDYAEEVQELCENEHPDLILMDIMLNGSMSGVDAAEKLRETGHSTAIIFISALSDATTQSRIKEIEHSSHIAKPFDHHQLVSLIKETLT